MNTDTQVVEEAVITPAKNVADSFNAELEKVGIDPKTGEIRQQEIEDANDVTQTAKPAAKEKVVEKETEQKEKSEFPEELLTGKKATKAQPTEDFLTSEAPSELKGKSREHFKNLQVQSGQLITSLRGENSKLQAELEALRKGNETVDTKELEQLRKDREELNAELERVAMERSPRFKKEFLSQEESIKAQALRALKATGADETLFEQAISSSDKKRFEILGSEELNEGQRSALSSLLVQYDLLQDKKNSALANSKEYAQSQAEEQQKSLQAKRQADEAEEARIFESVGKKVSSEFEPFMEIEGNEEWNAQVRENREMARNFFAGKASLQDLAEIAHYGIGARTLHKLFRNLQSKYNALIDSHSEVIASNPSVNGRHETKEAPKEETVEQRRMRTFREEMASVQNQG